jgi:hypothetical protein
MWASMPSALLVVCLGVVFGLYQVFHMIFTYASTLIGRRLALIYSRAFRTLFIFASLVGSLVVPTALLSVAFVVYSLLLTIAGINTAQKRVFSIYLASSIYFSCTSSYAADFSYPYSVGLQK